MNPADFDFNMVAGHAQSAPVDWELMNRLMGVTAVFMEEAVNHAAEYSKAAGRTTIHPKDMLLGLKYTALPRGGFYTTENLAERAQEWINRFNMDESDSSSSSDEGGKSDEEAEEEEEWTQAETTTENALIAGMNAAEAEWDSWQPQTREDQMVRNAIERACLRFDESELNSSACE